MAPPEPGTTALWLGFLTPAMTAALIVTQLLIKQATDRKLERVAEAARISSEDAAHKVSQVAKVAEVTAAKSTQQLEEIKVISEKTHTLVNSQHGLALALVLEKAMKIAHLTPKEDTEGTRLAADEVVKAKNALADHEAKQRLVDLGATGM